MHLQMTTGGHSTALRPPPCSDAEGSLSAGRAGQTCACAKLQEKSFIFDKQRLIQLLFLKVNGLGVFRAFSSTISQVQKT